MIFKQKPQALKAAFVFSFTLLLLFFQNCSGSFKSVTQETNTSSNSQSTGGQGGGALQPTLPGSPSTPVTPTTPVLEYGNYKAVTGFTKLISLNNRICNIDSAGVVSCLGTLEQPGSEDANGYPKGAFTDKLTNMNFNLNVKKLVENCMLTVDEKVYCYRYNSYGELGSPAGNPRYAFTPVQINLGEPAKSLAQASGALCASLASGIVKCWARRLDLAKVDGQSPSVPTPGPVAGLNNVKEVFANLYPAQFCALLTNNDVYCWGQKIDSVPETENWDYTPAKVFNSAGIKKVITGTADKFCILFESGQVSCFSSRDSNTGLVVLSSKITQAVDVTSNEGTRCAKVSSGDVYCWGRNMFGRLGFIRTHWEDVISPTAIPEWKNAVSVSAAMYNTCALMPDSSVKCLGLANGSYRDWMRFETSLSQLGINESISAAVPMPYGGICYRTVSGSVQCLGDVNAASDFAVASSAFQKSGSEILAKPIVITGGTLNSINFAKATLPTTNEVIGSGCFIDAGSVAKCFGDNTYGQLGNGTTTASYSAVSVSGLSNVTKIEDYGGYTRCAVTSQNRLYCWGSGMSGVFDGVFIDSKNPNPIEITQVGAVKDVFLDYQSVSVIQTDGALKSYGIYKRDISGFKAYDYASGCAHMNDNSLNCYFYVGGTEPYAYKKINNVSSNSLKFFGSCIINDAKNVQCWGDNSYGLLGQGDRSSAYGLETAMTVKGIANASMVFSDEFGLQCAYVDENMGSKSRILCWGSNWEGWNLSLAVFEKTDLRGFKPIINPRYLRAEYYMNSAGQLKIFDNVRIPTAPFVLLQRK